LKKNLKLEKNENREYIRTRIFLKVLVVDINKELYLTHGDDTSKYRTLTKWVALFKDDREGLNDYLRCEGPITVHTNANQCIV
jgi:hypothetical protein